MTAYHATPLLSYGDTGPAHYEHLVAGSVDEAYEAVQRGQSVHIVNRDDAVEVLRRLGLTEARIKLRLQIAEATQEP